MSGQSDRHPRPSLEEASPERVQLVDSTGGLDEFAPEPERSLLRSEPPGAPTPRPKVILGGTGTDVTRVQPSRFDWTRHASRVALVSAVVVAAVAGTVVLQSPATPPSAVDPTEPVTDSAPQLTVADPPPVSPSVVSTAPSEPPSVEAPIPSEVIPPPRGNLRGTPSTRARDTDSRSIPRVMAPSASLAVSATTPVPPRRGDCCTRRRAGALLPRARQRSLGHPCSPFHPWPLRHSRPMGRLPPRLPRLRAFRQSSPARAPRHPRLRRRFVPPPRTCRWTRWPGQQVVSWTLAPSRTCWADTEMRSTGSTPAPQWRCGRR